MRKEIVRANKEDAVLIAMLQEDKEKAIELIYCKYWNKLVQYAYNYLKDWDTSEEMVQKLFINIYVKNITLSKGLYLSGYLYRAVKNGVANQWRKQSVYNRHIALNNPGSTMSMDHVQGMMESFDVKVKINQAVEAIPEKIRVVYLLNREQQLTIREISRKLQRPEDTIDKQLRRAVHFLRTHLNALLV